MRIIWTAAAIAVGLASINIGTAEATFSITATDNVTKQIGAAGASCVIGSVYEALYQAVPGHGVLITQALPPAAGSPVYPAGDELLLAGTDPVVLLQTITDPTLDNLTMDVPLLSEDGTTFVPGESTPFEEYTLRQYGVVDLMGRAAGYTGEDIKTFYFALGSTEDFWGFNYTQEHFSGRNNNLTYSAQGNIVTDITVPILSDTFVTADDACDLADRLFQAIAAPFVASSQADNVEDLAGDVRCFGQNQASAAGIFLHVDDPDGNVVVHIDIVQVEIGNGSSPILSVNPFPVFVEAYESWRSANPCGSSGGDMTNATMAPTDEEMGSGTGTEAETTEAPASSSPISSTVSVPVVGFSVLLLMKFMRP